MESSEDLTDEQVREHIVTMWLRPRNPVEAAERWSPAQPHTCFILPFLFEGLNGFGIYIDHDHRLPRVFGLVLKVHPTCRRVKVMDICMFRPHAFDEYLDSRRDTLYALHEGSVRTILDFVGVDMELVPRPIWNFIIIEPKERVEVTDAGIRLPQTAAQHGPQEGTIEYVSADITDSRFVVGAYVMFSAYSSSEIKVKNRKLMLLKTTDVVAFFEEDSAPILQEITA